MLHPYHWVCGDAGRWDKCGTIQAQPAVTERQICLRGSVKELKPFHTVLWNGFFVSERRSSISTKRDIVLGAPCDCPPLKEVPDVNNRRRG